MRSETSGPFFDEVDHSVVENYLHLEVGMQGEELEQAGNDVEPREVVAAETRSLPDRAA
jgi:hypothetical protein